MLARYFVCYDIRDKKRLRLVHRKMRGYGVRVQYSVFRCDLSAREKAQLISELGDIIDHQADQVLLVNLGPAEGRGDEVVDALGLPYGVAPRSAVIV
ncbi:MAG: CRISPR-associated endonuclease Cas2 [Deltaproteobacteria bacterium]|nr:CRISPR-associated endonuclease Cas2 [Deltaproteobacteria bacterium]